MEDTLALILFGALTLVAIFYFISLRNSLVSIKEQVERSWANIDVVLKQRFDEIQQLVQVVEQYTKNENLIVAKVLEARQKYIVSQTLDQKVSSAQDASVAIKGVLALGENYPELKANQNFMQLQSRISGIEETISDRREFYNDAVTNYNTRMGQFPDLIITSQLGFNRKPLFQVADSEKVLPNLKMNVG